MRRSLIAVAAVLALTCFWLVGTGMPGATRTGAVDATASGPEASESARADDVRPIAAASEAAPEGRTQLTANDTAPAMPRTRVRVLDADHQPIEGATVETFADSAPGVATTDAAGWCEVPGANGDSQRLLVRAGARHVQAYWVAGPELTIRLPWWGPLRGRLLDADSGAPVAGATLKFDHPCKECEADVAVTDRDGAFTLAAVPRDQDIGMEVVADGYPQQYVQCQLPGRGEPAACTFRVQRGVMVAGRCIDLDTRQPIAGATVDCGNGVIATTDAGGHFAALVLRGREFSLKFSAPGYLWASYELPAPPSADNEFVLPRGAVLVGHVWSADGQPIAGARVSAREDYRQPRRPFEGMPRGGVSIDQASHQSIVTHTAADGSYRIEGLLPGPNLLFCRHDDYEPASESGVAVVASREGSAFDLRLQPRRPSGTIVGTFTVNGEPCDGSMRWHGPGREGYAQIDRAGRFRIERVEAGRVELIVVAHRFEDIHDRSRFELRRDIAVEAGQEAQVTLAQEIAVAAVRGTVRCDDGEPASGSHVFALPTRQSAKVGDDGTYEMQLPVLPGPHSLYCGNADRSVMPPADHVDFVVRRRGSLRLRAIDAGTGQDVGRARFLVVPAGEQGACPCDVRVAPDPDGYRRTDVARGDAVVLGWAEGFAPTVQRVVVGAEPIAVDLRLLRGCSVELRLATGAERPPDRLQVRWVDAALLEGDAEACLRHWSEPGMWSSPGRDVMLARGGTIRDVGAGRHHLVSSDPAIVIVPEYVDVLPGSAPVFELGWRRQH